MLDFPQIVLVDEPSDKLTVLLKTLDDPMWEVAVVEDLARLRLGYEDKQPEMILVSAEFGEEITKEVVDGVRRIWDEDLVLLVYGDASVRDWVLPMVDEGLNDVLWLPADPSEIRANVRGHVHRKLRLDDIRRRLELEHQHLALRARCLRLVAHDIDNPLTAIHLMAELLYSTAKSEEERSDVLVIVEAADLVEAQLESMLALVRMEGGEYELKVDSFDLCGAIEPALTRAALKKHVELDLPPHQVKIVGDKKVITQAVLDVGLNARRMLDDEDTVKVSLQRVDGMVLLDFVHGSAKLSPEHQERLIEMFGSVEIRAERVSVAAVGLACAARMLRQNEGSLTVMDGEQGGLTIRLAIPLA